MAAGDLLWCIVALKRPRRWVRWIGAAFGVLQFTGLAVILSSRAGVPLADAMPRPLHSMILAWHLIILLPWLAWRLVRGLVVLARKVARVVRHTPASGGSPTPVSPAANFSGPPRR